MFVHLLLLASAASKRDLISVSRTRAATDHKQCRQADVKTCVEAELDLYQLETVSKVSVPEVHFPLELLRREDTREKGTQT